MGRLVVFDNAVEEYNESTMFYVVATGYKLDSSEVTRMTWICLCSGWNIKRSDLEPAKRLDRQNRIAYIHPKAQIFMWLTRHDSLARQAHHDFTTSAVITNRRLAQAIPCSIDRRRHIYL